MANRILNMVFKADTAQAKLALKELEGDEKGGGIKGIAGAVTGLNSLLTAGVITGIAYSIQKAFGDYSNYVKEVDDLSASLGITVEEADGLLGSMKLFDASTPAMISAFRRMSTEGIDPTLENLGKILLNYDAMPEGAEKGVEAMRILGEQGIADLLPWWDNLSAYEKEHLEFLEYGPEVTRDMAKENDAFRDSVGGLTDAWSDLKNELLSGIIPTLTDVLEYITNAVEIANGLREQIQIISGYLYSGPNAMSSSEKGAAQAHAYGLSSFVRPADTRPARGERYATGGSFTVGGSGGTDSQPVNFMATPGETVSIGGGTGDMQNVLAEMRRLVNTLPIAIVDAMERR